MKTSTLSFICLLFFCISTYAQDRYVVFFTDKNNSPFSISNPSAFLSQRAIARRTSQNINITIQDLPVNPAYVSGVANAGATILNRSKWFNSVTINTNSQAVLSAINALPYVASVTNVGRLMNTSGLPSKFNDEQLRYKGSSSLQPKRTLSFNYGNSFNQVAMLKGDLMHQNGYTGQGKLIAVIDAGFSNVDNMPAFDSLFANNRIVATWDFVDGEANVYNDHHHGTMVLSVMGGNVPGEIIGTAPHASYLLLRSEDAPIEHIIEEYNWSSAAEYADSAGADIINSSLGYTLFDDPSQNHSYADLNGNTTPIAIAADIAASKGMVVCNSAGNEGNSSWFRISSPADADSILAVGAVDASSVYAGFSGKGPSFDGRVKPDVAAQGEQAIVSDPWTGTGTFGANGTSFSSPLMAGMIATLWQCHPTATNMQIINAVKMSANQYANPDSLLGYGIPDFPVACMLLAGLNPNNFENGDQLLVKGNPFGDELSFSFYTTVSQEITFKIFNLIGQPVHEETRFVTGFADNNFSISLEGAVGIYFLEVNSEDKVISRKVIKN